MLRSVRKGAKYQRALSASSPIFPGSGLNEDQLVWQDAAQKWGAAELGPFSAEWDAKCHYPIDVIKSSAEQGFLGLYTSEDVGGMGLSRLETSIVVEALSEHCVPTTAMMTIHNMVSWMIDVNGTPEQREEYCPRLTSGEIIGSYCLTEPGSGSDASALATTCVRDGDDYVLNGSKCFISGAGVHDLYAVMVRTDPATKGPKGISCVLIPKDTPGLSFGADETKMGWKSHPTKVLIMENCRVPVSNLLGVEGKGFNIAMSGLNGGRVNIASCSLGGAQKAMLAAKEHLGVRKAFGKTLDSQQYLQYKMAELATQLVTSRLMVRHAAAAIDQKDPAAASLCAMAKLHATDNCSEVANGCLQMFGGYGYLKDYPCEQIVRDLRVHSILEGANEVMRLIISRQLLSE
ncbi:unnamed protein product [Oikopleura dioica]|nr:unnamed protein product [Oikopleura dioica]CBY39392.1 unnamed protein product [Oikopleura dioica]